MVEGEGVKGGADCSFFGWLAEIEISAIVERYRVTHTSASKSRDSGVVTVRSMGGAGMQRDALKV